MDAHKPVTLEEGDRYPLGPPSYAVGLGRGHVLRILDSRARFDSGGCTQTFQRHWIVWSHTMRNGVTTVGGTLLAVRALAARKRSLSGSGWRVCEICGATQEMMHYNYRRGMQSIFVFIVLNLCIEFSLFFSEVI